jgi:NAD(P)-dependent dehydrogenase (short-subunit alcohol dehydrogenase family)
MYRKSAKLRGTEMDTSFLALGRAGHQKEVPPLVEFLISDSSSYITGTAMSIDGGWNC